MARIYEFRSIHATVDAIKKYAFHLWKQKSSDIKRVEIGQDFMNDDVIFTLSPGNTYRVTHNGIDIDIYILESDNFEGTASGVMKWTELLLYVVANSYADAEKYIKNFITDALNFNKRKKEEEKVNIFIYEKIGGWRCISTLPRRSMDTIYMDLTEKKKLLDDVTKFMSSEKEYIEYGIPYKRCYLLEGVAGSGKSSTIFAIASILGKDINIFNFSVDVTDTVFISAISQTPSDRILVFEDIDSLFVDRSPIDTNHVSISAFLNVLDGVCRRDKMLLFITTNHMNRLDKAIIRPGRIDYILKFNFASKIQIKQMYDKLRKERASTNEFEAFYKMVAGKKINMSLIQKFLFEHREDPSIVEYEKELATLIHLHEEKDAVGII